ncbi:hypothetical protein HDU86_000570 [Geranomyces michiganensis]|nr:hypothetical protein HDU86_000570 [Geranomyces michiganensis]
MSVRIEFTSSTNLPRESKPTRRGSKVHPDNLDRVTITGIDLHDSILHYILVHAKRIQDAYTVEVSELSDILYDDREVVNSWLSTNVVFSPSDTNVPVRLEVPPNTSDDSITASTCLKFHATPQEISFKEYPLRLNDVPSLKTQDSAGQTIVYDLDYVRMSAATFLYNVIGKVIETIEGLTWTVNPETMSFTLDLDYMDDMLDVDDELCAFTMYNLLHSSCSSFLSCLRIEAVSIDNDTIQHYNEEIVQHNTSLDSDTYVHMMEYSIQTHYTIYQTLDMAKDKLLEFYRSIQDKTMAFDNGS